MGYQVTLPCTNENEYYEIRLESIGGLGANLCGKMLGELGAVYMDLNASSFSSYGSEKRGSPVKSYIRYSNREKEIRINSPVKNPNLLGLFHEAIIDKEKIMEGVDKNTKIVVNTDRNPNEMRRKLKLYEGEIYCIDALKIAMEEKIKINMVMLGALIRALDFIPLQAVRDIIKETIGKKYPSMLHSNIKGMERGYQEIQKEYFLPNLKYKQEEHDQEQVDWGYLNAPIGGINPCIGSTIINDISSSREGYIPLFEKEKCINCGLCDITCPDMVFQFQLEEVNGEKRIINKGLDYKHCKGCLRCVEICPTKALMVGRERNNPHLRYDMENQDLLKNRVQYEKMGSNSYVTSESFLTEKRVDGGIL